MNIYSFNTIIIGSGAAGYNTADQLYSLGMTDVAIVTDHIKSGTSRNTGSDKQTYYKLTLSGGDADSVREMAQTLFQGQCVDGDIALCEAALSAPSFLKLAELGVPFPKNRYGEYIGYKTDHDPRRRATSVGPYTSKMMTECLEKNVARKGIRIFDNCQAVRVLRDEQRVRGLICLNTSTVGDEDRFLVFCCENLVFATGGPASMYADSVYPKSQFGASGLAFEAGVKGKNLTEWQFGLASTLPKWNVSGTYMQVLPRFVSVNSNGKDEKEFLYDFFTDEGELLSNVFLKGYQWPFDVRKVSHGSSIIDILVYLEQCKGRRVFLDFRSNPDNTEEINYAILAPEAREYLVKAGACFGKPIDRLAHMNAPAVEFYRDKGVDLYTSMLEIALCAQHNNGGLSVNCWWETNIPHFFAVGEVAGTHGVYRPGGSALNAGQVGSTRAAQYIAAKYKDAPIQDDLFFRMANEAVREMESICKNVLKGNPSNIDTLWQQATKQMSLSGGAIRNGSAIDAAIDVVKSGMTHLTKVVSIERADELHKVFRYRDMLISQFVYLSAMKDYIDNGGLSRGSALYTDRAGEKPYESLPDTFTFFVDDASRGDLVQETTFNNGVCTANWRHVRPIPEDDDFFENIWREYRVHQNVY